jgi:Na+/alanine symporter
VRALTTALAATVGTGSIVGVATAIGIGNMTQGNSISANLENSFNVPT